MKVVKRGSLLLKCLPCLTGNSQTVEGAVSEEKGRAFGVSQRNDSWVVGNEKGEIFKVTHVY
jgi:hypothetical protein